MKRLLALLLLTSCANPQHALIAQSAIDGGCEVARVACSQGDSVACRYVPLVCAGAKALIRLDSGGGSAAWCELDPERVPTSDVVLGSALDTDGDGYVDVCFDEPASWEPVVAFTQRCDGVPCRRLSDPDDPCLVIIETAQGARTERVCP